MCRAGLRFLVRICKDLGLPDEQEYLSLLKKAEASNEAKQKVHSSSLPPFFIAHFNAFPVSARTADATVDGVSAMQQCPPSDLTFSLQLEKRAPRARMRHAAIVRVKMLVKIHIPNSRRQMQLCRGRSVPPLYPSRPASPPVRAFHAQLCMQLTPISPISPRTRHGIQRPDRRGGGAAQNSGCQQARA